MTRAAIPTLALFSSTLVVCQPTDPSGGMGGTTGEPSTGGASTEGASMASAGTTSSTDGPLDSSDDTSTGTPFACQGARWHEGDLEIDDTTDLDALRDVGGVTGSLLIAETSSIVDLEFLSCLEIVEGDVFIYGNLGLVELRGLERLRVIEGVDWGPGFPALSALAIVENPALVRIDAFESLETIEGLRIGANETLTEIEMPALVQAETLLLGEWGYCEVGPPYQPLTSVGSYPALEYVGSLELFQQYMITSSESLFDLVDRGVTFGGASFRYNYALPQSEIDAFAAAASIVPEICPNEDDPGACPCRIK